MQINRTTVPGRGVLHSIVTRGGEKFGLMVDIAGNRHLFIYDGADPDIPAQAILLEPDEADEVAEVLHSRPVADRLLLLERRVDELAGERGPI